MHSAQRPSGCYIVYNVAYEQFQEARKRQKENEELIKNLDTTIKSLGDIQKSMQMLQVSVKELEKEEGQRAEDADKDKKDDK